MRTTTERFEEYVSLISQQLGHADRVDPFRGYCTGLLLPVQRKSVEPMAAHLAPTRVRSEHQRLHHFVADAAWSDESVLAAVRDYVLERVVPRAGAPEALLLDDTGFPKQGVHSVDVARQYCGQLGKQDNCQVAFSVSLANEAFSVPVAYQLYLPKEWAADSARRQRAKVPETASFATKPALALQLLEPLRAIVNMPNIVVADAGYGVDTAFWERLTALGFSYVVGITGAVSMWPEARAPLPPKPWSGRGRKAKLVRRGAHHQPLSTKALALQLPGRRFRIVIWRDNTHAALSSRFAGVRVRCAHHDYWRTERHHEQWLLIEWPHGEAKLTKYFLSTLPLDTARKELVRLAKLRWHIERDYQELKQELGLVDFEGRSWRGFHHHARLCIAAYAFLLTQRLVAPKKLCRIRFSAKCLPYLKASGPAAPLRRQRHVPDSITVLRRELAVALIAALDQCPCCGRKDE